MYAYIDESGDTGQSSKSTKNFILAAIMVEDDSVLELLARRAFKKKIKSKHKINQLHARDNGDKVHKYILKELEHIMYSVIYENEKSYYVAVDNLFKKLKKMNMGKVFFAIRNNKKSEIIKIEKIASEIGLEVIQSTPVKNKGLQIADFVSWSIFRSVEFYDKTCSRRLNILNPKEK